MTQSLSTRIRLLMEGPPLNGVDTSLLMEQENLIQAWQLPFGEELAREAAPFGFVIRVVEGSLRVSGRDLIGQEFTLRKLGPGEWWGAWSALNGQASASVRTASDCKLLAVPVEVWQQWWQNSPALGAWDADHPQRDDTYSALRPLFCQRERQEVSIHELLDRVQTFLCPLELRTSTELQQQIEATTGSSWFVSGSERFLPDHSPPGVEGFSLVQLQQALRRSAYGLRLFALPKVDLEALMLTPPLEDSADSIVPVEVLELRPAWENPDGAQLLAQALEQEQAQPRKDIEGLVVRPVFGSSATEQGLALLQMVCEVLHVPFRRDVVDRLLRSMVGDRSSPSLEQLGQIGDAIGFSAVMMAVPAPHLARLPMPALLELPDGPVLLVGERKGFLRVIDPREGERRIRAESLLEETPVLRAITLSRRPQTAEKRFDISYFFPFLQQHRSSLVLVFVASFFINIFGLAQPLLIQQIIDKVIGQQNFNTLYFIGVLLIGSSIISNVLNLIRTFLFVDTTNRIDIATSGNILTHLFRLPLGYFDNRPIGEISTRLAELGNIRGFLTGTVLTLVLDVIFGVVYLFVCLTYSGLLTAVALAVVPLYLALIYIVSPVIKRQLRLAAESNAAASSLMVEALTGIHTVKAQHAETTLRWKWQQRYARFISSNFRTTIIGTTAGAIGSFFNEIGGLAVLWVGAYLVIKGELSVGQLIAFRIISGNVVGPILRLAGTWQTVQGLQISVERLADVVDAQTEQPLDLRPIALPPIQGKVEFEKVCFRFNPNSPLVVKNVSFTIEPGKFVGIVGQSGSGKSTIMKLLPRLYAPAEGVVRIDDYDIAKVDLDSLRQQLGIVPQDSLLFDGSIRDNIALNAPDASDDEVIHSAQVACAHGFIMELPQGYASNVGERGSALSGGQRQRIAIARAIMARPRLLILDEATSALDYLTERTLCENLKRELRSDTVFFITHRLATIRNADVIILMENGLLQEAGTHAELLHKRGLYYALYRQQDASVN
ncbi:peptidase domain-containing ABC transporter [Synechococcus lacustris C3-12m-Tous]|nr:peptidase domain-containing ABC transporter [Synechococcus lacustris C3-12m-Tous]